ncbi:hypothetical protein ACG904_09620 [Acinetobacter guillouiae]|uniref:hypothetical protein n=1 Tax=Acinetobacter guillouiae TaxID=106649 RepID=UPI003AF999B4
MRNITDPYEIQQHEEELLEYRRQDQERNQDYDFYDGIPDSCSACKSLINSHGHCPRCDY